jgi:hypothetical protein
MTTTTHRPDLDVDRPPPARRVSWWRRPWVAPLAVVALMFVAFSLPPYLTLDPARSRVPQPDGFDLHYPLLVAHVVFGSIALLTCWLQVWPWFRRRHRTAHRRVGRLYVFGGVLPAGVLGLVIGATSPFGPVVRVSNVMLAGLWLAVTITGYRMTRQRRYVEHRRWMIRSFALTVSIITNRIWGVMWFLVLSPRLDGAALTETVAGLSAWLGWTVTLLVAEWWLERPARPRVHR